MAKSREDIIAERLFGIAFNPSDITYSNIIKEKLEEHDYEKFFTGGYARCGLMYDIIIEDELMPNHKEEVVKSIDSRMTSRNGVEVERAHITKEEWEFLRTFVKGPRPSHHDCIGCGSSDTEFQFSDGDGVHCPWDVFKCNVCGKYFEDLKGG